jgi:hypothetical protein
MNVLLFGHFAMDKRIDRRRVISYRAYIKIGIDIPLIGCTVRDISETGAQLIVPGAIPEKFLLYLSMRVIRRCSVIWRREKRVGVRFIGRSRPEKRS